MTLREHLQTLVLEVLNRKYTQVKSIRFDVSKPREKSFGDFATNVAMVAAKQLRIDPMEIAEAIAPELRSCDVIEDASVARPGFINITLTRRAYLDKLADILSTQDDEAYGYADLGQGKRVQVEFVSANPTGPLNVVNARAAAVGDALVRLLKRVGYDAQSEFYVNDSGTQVELLGESLKARFQELLGRASEIPDGGYPGTYLIDIAKKVIKLSTEADALDSGFAIASQGSPVDFLKEACSKTGQTPASIQAFIDFIATLDPSRMCHAISLYICHQTTKRAGFNAICSQLQDLKMLITPQSGERRAGGAKAADVFLGEVYDGWHFDFSRFAVEEIVEEQQRSLQRFGKRPEGGLRFDCWFRESSLTEEVDKLAQLLISDGRFIAQKDGAIWLRSTGGEESEEWVIRRSSGQPTYFLSDIAYHINKRRRGYERVIDIWGPDHHGHVKRMQRAMEIVANLLPDLNLRPDWLTILIAQQVNLLKDGKRIQMSKRGGEYVTLDDLIREVGADVARFFFLMRRCNSHLDFDIDLAKKTSDENPVYYVQYAHARICSIIDFAKKQGYEEVPQKSNLELLSADEEIDLLKALADFEDLVIASANALEPHRFTSYLIDLASKFHRFYHNHRVVTEDPEITKARLCLCLGVRTVIRSAFSIMGISAPESM